MKVLIETIPHENQAYETVGNYTEKIDADGNPYLHIEVSEHGDDRFNFLVALHELVEFHLCKHRGIKDEEIVAFDKRFEADRKPGNEDEPGFAIDAPYRREHTTATGIEAIMAAELDVPWEEYGHKAMSL